jgi:hypothetical protein
MKAQGPGYQVVYDAESATVTFSGEMRPYRNEECLELDQLLTEVVALAPAAIKLDVRPLRYLNSLSIMKLSRFAARLREKGHRQVTVYGTRQIPWQPKSLENLLRLAPGVVLEWT